MRCEGGTFGCRFKAKEEVNGRALCGIHAHQARNDELIENVAHATIPEMTFARILFERYESYVDRISTPDGCHVWQGRMAKGYGRFTYYGQRVGAHRVAFRLERGRWPHPQANHYCGNPACVRVHPEHVYEGTHQQNMDDAIRHRSMGNRQSIHHHGGNAMSAVRSSKQHPTDDDFEAPGILIDPTSPPAFLERVQGKNKIDQDIHPGFGNVTLCCNGATHTTDATGDRTLNHYDQIIRRTASPHTPTPVWTLHIDAPFRSLIYAFTPEGWTLIDTKDGFA